MAMNKAEKQMVKDLRIRTALRMEQNALPDVLPPKYGEPCEMRVGYEPNYHNSEIRIGLTTPHAHTATWISRDKDFVKCLNELVKSKSSISMSQGSRTLFSKRIDALRAIRYELQMKFARELASIDEAIDEELASTHPMDQLIERFNSEAIAKLIDEKSAGNPE